MKRLALVTVLAFISVYASSQFGPELWLNAEFPLPLPAKPADFDGDGDMDVFIWPIRSWLENDGQGDFGEPNAIGSEGYGIGNCEDLNGDGHVDVLFIFPDEGLIWFENDGIGNFGNFQIIDANNASNLIYCTDLDEDGDMDILTSSFNDNSILWYENDGIGNFGSQQIISTDVDGPTSIFSADLDGDGDMDVLSASMNDNKVAWYQNDGVGNFGPQNIIVLSSDLILHTKSADLDGDGDMDVLGASISDAKITWYQNDGVGNFGEELVISQDFSEGSLIKDINCADLDGDGDIDVVSSSQNDNKVAWYQNDGVGNFSDELLLSSDPLENAAESVDCSDLDNDGDLDVLAGAVFWVENLMGGCMDPDACNFDPESIFDSGICCFGVCACTNENACNYDPSADCDDSSCTFPGCNDITACNYNPEAGCDDGSCIPGCQDEDACNFNPLSECNEGCTYPGCTDPGSINYAPAAGCDDGSCIPAFGNMIMTAPDSMLYSDTLTLQFDVVDGTGIYACYNTISFDNNNLVLVGWEVGTYLEDEIISTSPEVTNNQIEFGATKLGAIPGSSGTGDFYFLQFVPIAPLSDDTLSLQFVVENIDCFNDEGIGGSLFSTDTLLVDLYFEAEVWPGDLNNNGAVTVEDILPIGYFYGETGPERPNASLAWESQKCPMWDVGAEYSGDGFYKVFADGNGDGDINLSDQVAVGFNLNQTIELLTDDLNLSFLLGSSIQIMSTISPSTLMLPEDESFELIFSVYVDGSNADELFGFSLNIDFGALGIDATEVEVDYSSTQMGELNTNLIALDYANGSVLNVAMTKTEDNYPEGNLELFRCLVPVQANWTSGNYPIEVQVGSANDSEGFDVSLEANDIQVPVISAIMGCIDQGACNYNPDATLDDSSCLYVGDICDDGDPETVNDIIQESCSCQGDLEVNIDEHNSNRWIVYPNPSSDFITLKLPNEEIFWIIIDSNGKTILRGKYPNENVIDVSSLEAGSYFISLRSPDSGVKVIKSIIVN